MRLQVTEVLRLKDAVATLQTRADDAAATAAAAARAQATAAARADLLRRELETAQRQVEAGKVQLQQMMAQFAKMRGVAPTAAGGFGAGGTGH